MEYLIFKALTHLNGLVHVVFSLLYEKKTHTYQNKEELR
jgi:hypothetical protein